MAIIDLGYETEDCLSLKVILTLIPPELKGFGSQCFLTERQN